MGAVVHIYDFIPYFNVSFIFFVMPMNTQPTIPSFCNDEGLTSSKRQLPYLFIEEMLPISTTLILNCNKKKVLLATSVLQYILLQLSRNLTSIRLLQSTEEVYSTFKTKPQNTTLMGM